MASVTSTSTKPHKVIGTRPVRHDGVPKVTGEAKYGADMHLPRMLFGKVLRSPHPHAIIKSINTKLAEAHPDVRAVATAKDLIPKETVGQEVVLGVTQTDNVLANSKVLYSGHAIAAVAATNPHVAEEALSLIEVEYEILPAVTTVEEAMKPDAPWLHEDWAIDNPDQIPNVAGQENYQFGDLANGFDLADLVVEREFRTQSVHQGYIEPQNATASWPPDDRLTIWCSSQGHFGIRTNVARVLGISESEIKVVPMEIGGGFGGKLNVYLEPIAAILSKKSGCPVKMWMTRSEVLEATGPASGSYIRVKMGATRKGQITGAQIYYAYEAGAYPGAPLAGAAAAVLAPYHIENVQIDAFDVVDNKPKTSAYRAPGATVAVFAIESLIDEIAENLNIDPVKLRLQNAAKEGTRRADGVMNVRIGAQEVMEAVHEHQHYSDPINDTGKDGLFGRGIAMGFCRNNSGMACVVANVLDNGKISLVEGSVDIGGSRTAVSQQLAEVLGIPVMDVIPQVADTDTIGYTSNTGGSGVAYKSGWAAHDAANDIKDQLIKRASMIWEVPSKDIAYVDGALQHNSDPELRMTFKEIAAILPDTGGPVVGRANINPGGLHGSYAANIVDVEVDPETGKVDILRYTAFQDAGKAIHPSYVEGQIQGGTTQGIGWALNEEYFMSSDGRMLNTSFLDYRMPTSYDVPMIEPVIVEVPSAMHPFGVRGVGEANIVPPPAAIANAIHNATGIRMRNLPMSPGSILKTIQESNSDIR